MKKKQSADQPPQPADILHGIPPKHGTYALIYRCDAPFQAVVGKLGPVSFSSGYWIYVGSAFGPGGLKSRLRHHLGPPVRPHWHLDHIKHALRPVEIWLTTDIGKQEHAWAGVISRLRGATCPIAGFGASDCTCRAHLIHRRRRPDFSGFDKRIRSTIDGRLMRIPLSR